MRGDYKLSGIVEGGLSATHEDKDLGTTGHIDPSTGNGLCSSGSVDRTEDGQPMLCKGEKI